MKTSVTFKSQNNQQLSGILHTPDTNEIQAYALFAHCFTCTKDINAATNVAKTLAKQGIATLRFDFAGLGASEGVFADTRAVLAAAQQLPSVKAIVTIGSPASPDHALHVLDGHLETLIREGEAVIPLAGRPHRFKQNFVEDITKHIVDPSTLKKALMVMHAPFDTIVGIDEATKIFSRARHPKNFVSLDQADHLLSRKKDATYVGDIIASWAKRYIDPLSTKPHMDVEKNLIVKGNPYDYLSTALGSCTSMTLNGYARRKKLDVTSISVRVEHDRIHAQDCDSCEKTQGKVDRFTRHIKIEGNITPAQHKRMLEIADLCPVHKTLENEIKIDTRTEEAA